VVPPSTGEQRTLYLDVSLHSIVLVSPTWLLHYFYDVAFIVDRHSLWIKDVTIHQKNGL